MPRVVGRNTTGRENDGCSDAGEDAVVATFSILCFKYELDIIHQLGIF
jgi:hypothetical protein